MRERTGALRVRRFVAAALRRYPFYSGYGRIANSTPLRRLASWSTGSEAIRVRLRDGSALLVQADEFVGRAALFFGDLDPKVTFVCNRLLRSGDVVVDAGANVGLVTLVASARVGATGRVHAFEPQPELVRLLRESVALNRRTNVTVHDVALGVEDGRLPLNIPAHNLGAASLVQASARGETIEVPVRRLADHLGPAERRRVRLLKLDVEGFELQVLEGARPLLRRQPPDAVLFECRGAEPFWDRPVVKLLREHGYCFLAPAGRFLRPRFVPVAADAQEPPAHDVLAVHRRALPGVRRALA